jgi:cytochrome c-type biogenesis protein CcmH
MELVAKALALDPNQWKALAMAGTEAFERKDYKAAITHWERLKATAGAESQLGKQIQGSIDEARQLAGLPPSTAPAEPMAASAGKAPAGSAKADVAAASKADAATTGKTVAAAAGKTVSGTVTLEKALAAKASPTDAVFVFARPADGSKMPIALTRAQVKDLPLKFTLDDTTSMNPQVKISAFQDVILVARVSKSGSAMPASGDLEGLSQPVKVGSTGVAVTIDRALP